MHDAEPLIGAYVPDMQTVHSVEVIPAVFPKLRPATQLMQALAPAARMYEPAAQSLQLDAPLVEYVPLVQTEPQAVAPVET